MSGLRPTTGIVTLAALDVRLRPEHAGEMGSQLLLGEVVRVTRRTEGGRWLFVENSADRYRGWVRSWGVLLAAPSRIAAWRRRARTRATALWTEVRESPGRGPLVTPLFWGSRVIAGRSRGRFRRVELPDGRRGWAEAKGLAPGSARPRPLLERAQELLGVPYLWGGRTPAGLDCSGLVQMILAEQGIHVPRDAGDQERAVRPIPRGGRPRPGDLAFFGPPGAPAGHVGVMVGDGLYLHARGQVRVNSLHPDNALYDNALKAQLRGHGRPVR
jgi:gamma-D-glutamyl-L-lysine dipeptidyl-peptidase